MNHGFGTLAASDLPALGLRLLGAGFLVANLRIIAQLVQFLRYRSRALVTWPGRRPSHYGFFLGLGVVFAILVVVKIFVQQRPPADAFGEFMMLLYYGYLWPMSFRIGRGIYRHGVWAESGFLRDGTIGGLSWREEPDLRLVVISRLRPLARPLFVPSRHYAEVRRVLRDKIASREIDLAGTSLNLGGDGREVV